MSEEYGDVNIMNYIKVIRKRKAFVFIMFLLGIALAVSYNFLPQAQEKIYNIKSTLEIGTIIYDTPNGFSEVQAIENPAQIVKKIENSIYDYVIRERLDISEINLWAKNPEGTNLIIVEMRSANREDKIVLDEINNLILAEHQKRVNIKKRTLQDSISILENNIEVLKKDSEILKREISIVSEILEREINMIRKKIMSLKRNEKILEKEIELFENASSQNPGIQFTMLYLQDKLEEVRQSITNSYTKIFTLEKENIKQSTITKYESSGEIISFQNQINSIQKKVDNINSTKVIKASVTSEIPGLSPILNIVIGAILGLFIGISSSLMLEWWQKNKVKI